jgi:hypothetical protein
MFSEIPIRAPNISIILATVILAYPLRDDVSAPA